MSAHTKYQISLREANLTMTGLCTAEGVLRPRHIKTVRFHFRPFFLFTYFFVLTAPVEAFWSGILILLQPQIGTLLYKKLLEPTEEAVVKSVMAAWNAETADARKVPWNSWKKEVDPVLRKQFEYLEGVWEVAREDMTKADDGNDPAPGFLGPEVCPLLTTSI